MPAVSKAQQRFFGMVRSAQKGEMKNPSSEVLDVADDISVKDAKKFAKTKHKGLPEKKKMKENVTLQDANGNDFIEIVDLIKPEPLVKKEEDKAFNYVLSKLKKKHGDGVLTKRDKIKPQSSAAKAKARAHQAKVDAENAAERKKDPSQGRYPKGYSNRGSD